MFVLESNAGLSKGDAFLHLEQKFQGTPLLHFIRCIERMTEQRGDLVKMLQGLKMKAISSKLKLQSGKIVKLNIIS